jgi:cell division transport system permease protein
MIGLGVALKQAFSQINRNKLMTTASLFSITAILLVLGIFFLIIVNINNMAEGVKQDFDQIQIYLLDEVAEEQSAEMMEQIRAISGVESVTYLPREAALEQWKVKWGENADLLDRMPNNPLPNSIIIMVTNLDYANEIVKQVEPLEGIEQVNYSQDAVDKLLDMTRIIQIVSLIIILALVVISILVVSNTIKLTVLAREREIAIMRYIGATNWFIRGPFLLEGVIIGAVAAVIGAVACGAIYYYAVGHFGVDLALFLPTGFVPFGFMMVNLLIIFLSLGICVGACGSLISMRRFLER